MKTQTLILMLVAVVFSTGCTTFKQNMPKFPSLTRDAEMEVAPESEVQEPSFGTPVKMMAVWKDSVRSTPGEPSMRGFGGRIFLYDANDKPIRAKGELVVYGFDDSVKDREGSKADQKIVVSNQKFQRGYSKSGLGDSYSVWIDWDKTGSPDKSVTLIPFFRMPDGNIVKAGQAIYTLQSGNGDKLYKEKLASNEEDVSNDSVSHVSRANYLQVDGDNSGVVTASGMESLPSRSIKKSVRTTTIRVPMETQQRLRESTYFKSSTEANEVRQEDAVTEVLKQEKLVSPIEAARKMRREEIRSGKAFGMPGQL